jgi:hypothetical protein
MNESSIKVLYFLKETVPMIVPNYLSPPSCTLIIAPSGTRHLAHSCVAPLEKGEAIPCELRLAVNQMTSSHSQRLMVAVH